MSFDYVPETTETIATENVVDSFVFDWNAVEAIAA